MFSHAYLSQKKPTKSDNLEPILKATKAIESSELFIGKRANPHTGQEYTFPLNQ